MTVCVPVVSTKGESYRLSDAKARTARTAAKRGATITGAGSVENTGVAGPVDVSRVAE